MLRFPKLEYRKVLFYVMEVFLDCYSSVVSFAGRFSLLMQETDLPTCVKLVAQLETQYQNLLLNLLLKYVAESITESIEESSKEYLTLSIFFPLHLPIHSIPMSLPTPPYSQTNSQKTPMQLAICK